MSNMNPRLANAIRLALLAVAILAGIPGISEGQETTHTITSVAGAGGLITGGGQFPDKSTPTFEITAFPGFSIRNVLVDGVPMGKKARYTFPPVTMDHTIRANFQRNAIDYFGLDAGNFIESRSNLTGQIYNTRSTLSFEASTGTFRADTTGDQQSSAWFKKTQEGIGLVQEMTPTSSLVLTTPLITVKADIAAGDTWESQSSGTVYVPGASAPLTMKIEASVDEKVIVSVPAGAFEAFPISYKTTATVQGNSKSLNWIEWFVPYIGTVRAKRLGETAVMTGFGVSGGLISTPPPIITGATLDGRQLTVDGYNFGARSGSNQGQTLVKSILNVGGKNITRIGLWQNKQIICTLPLGATGGDTSLFTGFWTSNAFPAF